MDLRNKTFRNNRTGEVVKVIDSFENIAILENKQKVDVNRLTNNEYFTEQVDPKNFFSNQSAYNILADKIKSIPLNQIRDEDGVQQIQVNPDFTNSPLNPSFNESAIVMSSEEDERAELARKYGVNPNPVDSIQKQNEAFARILGDNVDEDFPIIQEQPKVDAFFSQDTVQRVEVQRDIQEVPVSKDTQVIEDPIITMFRKTKRNVDFKISFDVNDKIPRIDFIEMMEDSYETSMIEFLADEFTNKILQDPSIIKNKIKDKIKEIVYGKDKVSTESTPNKTVTKTSVRKTKTQKKDTLKND